MNIEEYGSIGLGPSSSSVAFFSSSSFLLFLDLLLKKMKVDKRYKYCILINILSFRKTLLKQKLTSQFLTLVCSLCYPL